MISPEDSIIPWITGSVVRISDSMITPSIKDRRLFTLRKSRVLIAQTWESQLNLSLFLVMLVVTVFLMPALGLERPLGRFSRDVTFSIVLVSGVTIAWGQRRLFVFSSCVATVALGVRWAAWWYRTDDFALFARDIHPCRHRSNLLDIAFADIPSRDSYIGASPGRAGGLSADGPRMGALLSNCQSPDTRFFSKLRR